MNVAVVNPAFPQLLKLAQYLNDHDELSIYVTRFVTPPLLSGRSFSSLPFLGGKLSRELMRRKAPEGLPSELVVAKGALGDLGAVAISRLSPIIQRRMEPLSDSLRLQRNRSLSIGAKKSLLQSDAVVAALGVAREAFVEAKAHGKLCVLDYPIAHHIYSERFLSREAEQNPIWSSTLQSHRHSDAFKKRYDEETELADVILVGSQYVKDSFELFPRLADKVRVVPYGVDFNRFDQGLRMPINHRVMRYLFVGQIGQRKGIGYLLEAFSQIRSDSNSLTLVGRFVGDLAPFEKYRGSFTHVPHVPRSDMPEVFHSADVFVFPTLLEGMPLVVLEAMASGLPVITTNHGPAEVVRDGVDGFIVPVADVEALSRRMSELASDSELWKAQSDQARSRAASFTWERYASSVRGILDGGL